MVTTGIAQVMVNMLDRGWGIQEAISAPRVHSDGALAFVDARIPPLVIDRLRAMGHRFELTQSDFGRPAFARINAILIDRERRLLHSGTDPFGDAGAAGI